MKYLLHIILSILLISSCSHRDKLDARLIQVEELAQNSPVEALDSLSAVDYSGLDDENKLYYDFLQVKVADKAGIQPTSDSLIIKVLAYPSTKREKLGVYEESLYYAGKVYSYLGDYQTALKHFQHCLEHLPASTEHIELRANALRECGNTLSELRLYTDAVPYFEEAIVSDRQLGDSLLVMLDLQLLGQVYLKQNDLDHAQHNFTEAYRLSKNFDQSYHSLARMNLAKVKYLKNQIDSARILIDGVPQNIDGPYKDEAFAVAAMIYHKSQMPDSAYFYAQKLIASENMPNRKAGLSVLLSPELTPYISADSLTSYVGQYRELVEGMLSQRENEVVQIQQAQYSYVKGQKEKKRSESNWFILAGIALGVVFMILRNKNKTVKSKLDSALEHVGQLEKNLSQWDVLTKKENKRIDTDIKLISVSNEATQDMKEKLRGKLMDIYNSGNLELPAINPQLLQSEAYEKLQTLIAAQKELKDSSSLWKDLEAKVFEVSPNFKDNLQLLLSGKLTSFDLRTAILIKYGVSPTQMATLFSRSKSAISSRRESLSQRIFDSKESPKALDAVIRLL